MQTIRVQKTDGSWLPLKCTATEQTGHSATITVPEWRGTWVIHSSGMVGNVGGNDWRIYTLHPEDCAELCKVPTDSDKGDNAAPCPECSATGQHYRVCSQFEE